MLYKLLPYLLLVGLLFTASQPARAVYALRPEAAPASKEEGRQLETEPHRRRLKERLESRLFRRGKKNERSSWTGVTWILVIGGVLVIALALWGLGKLLLFVVLFLLLYALLS
ncbi:MAG: hypothetical protein KDC30_12480 [Saprospiraceae bacterium]|nr:hypothetical protein [Saprospiraceae bacterium]MCB0677503.1 hypothetical protein [Saprospiraceae bacterium]